MAQQAAELKQDLQSAAPQRLEAEGLIPDAEGVFTVLCPVCRSKHCLAFQLRTSSRLLTTMGCFDCVATQP